MLGRGGRGTGAVCMEQLGRRKVAVQLFGSCLPVPSCLLAYGERWAFPLASIPSPHLTGSTRMGAAGNGLPRVAKPRVRVRGDLAVVQHIHTPIPWHPVRMHISPALPKVSPGTNTSSYLNA